MYLLKTQLFLTFYCMDMFPICVADFCASCNPNLCQQCSFRALAELRPIRADIESRVLPLNWQRPVKDPASAKHFETQQRPWRPWRGSTTSPPSWRTRGGGAWRRRRRRTWRGTASARATTAGERVWWKTEVVARVWSLVSNLRRSCRGRGGKASSLLQVERFSSSLLVTNEKQLKAH